MRRFSISFLFLAGILHAQYAFDEQWQASLAANKPELTLTISTPKTTLHIGEVIPLTIAFALSAQDPVFVDSLSWHCKPVAARDDLFVDPASSTEYNSGMTQEPSEFACLMGAKARLSSGSPFSMDAVLNDWVHFLAPGVYRVYLVSRRPGLKDGFEIPIESMLPLTSNILTLDIQPITPEWAAQQIAETDAILEAPMHLRRGAAVRGVDMNSRKRAATVLKYLNTREAAEELLKLWTLEYSAKFDADNLAPPEYGEILTAIYNSPYIDSSDEHHPVLK